MYIRKTKDEWHIMVNYGFGHGWEHETTETSYKDAKIMLNDYRNNVKYPVKMVKKRVKINK